MSKAPTTIDCGNIDAGITDGGKSLGPLHPGIVLVEDLNDENIAVADLAEAIHVSEFQVSAIISGVAPINADIAARLARYFGTSEQYWLNMQNRYDKDSVDRLAIDREVRPKKAA